MDGYLVLRRYTSDDIPVGLFATADEAKVHLEDNPNKFITKTLCAAMHDRNFVGAIVIGFKDGQPVNADDVPLQSGGIVPISGELTSVRTSRM